MKQPSIFFSLLAISSTVVAASNNNCAPDAGVCYSESYECTSCLGPTNTMVNAPARPHTCNGDFVLTVADLYWQAHQDGMQYAIRTDVEFPNPPLSPSIASQ